MKKVLIAIIFIMFGMNLVSAVENNNDDFEKPIILEPEENIYKKKVSPYTKKALKGIIEKEYDLNSVKGLFENQLSAQFREGIVKDISIEGYFINNLSETIDDNSNLKFNPNLINVGISGKFKGESEKYNFLFDLTPNIHDNFFHRLVLDAWIETNRIQNNTLIFGTSRPTVGFEGGMNPYTIPFITRSQSARTLGNIRKTGVRLKGDYKYLDYDIGGYSSDTYYSEFLPGIEGDFWVNFKPFANIKEKYGNLNIAGGAQVGNRNSTDFFTTTAAIRYNYKKFNLIGEYANADGYNGGGGLSDKKARGYNITLKYMLTKKLECLLRFDDFDYNIKKANNSQKEYSAGINYYILGQALRVMINYVLCDKPEGKNSHKIITGLQLLL